MKPGETITVQFALGPIHGTLSFKCPPPGQWEFDEAFPDLWEPVGGTLDGAFHRSGFELELIHDTVHYTPGAQGLAVAVHDHEFNSGHGSLFALSGFQSEQLVDELARRRDFTGVVVQGDGKRPDVTAGVRVKRHHVAGLLKSALETMDTPTKATKRGHKR